MGRDFVKDVKLVMMKKKSSKKSPQKVSTADGYDGKSALMRSDSDENLTEDEESDIDWRQGWSRIEQYIDIVDSEEDLKLEVEMTENDKRENETEKGYVLL